jgi:hypothetical protein
MTVRKSKTRKYGEADHAEKISFLKQGVQKQSFINKTPSRHPGLTGRRVIAHPQSGGLHNGLTGEGGA